MANSRLSRDELTVEYVREILDYDPETGVFRWKRRMGQRVRSGDIAGTIDVDGYRRIRFHGADFAAHHLAWFLMTGEWSQHILDHKNGDPDSNFWLNLREATTSQNIANSKKSSRNTSGFKGVSWSKQASAWYAYIVHNNKQIYLGTFEDVNEAAGAYEKAAKEIFGEFARFC